MHDKIQKNPLRYFISIECNFDPISIMTIIYSNREKFYIWISINTKFSECQMSIKWKSFNLTFSRFSLQFSNKSKQTICYIWYTLFGFLKAALWQPINWKIILNYAKLIFLIFFFFHRVFELVIIIDWIQVLLSIVGWKLKKRAMIFNKQINGSGTNNIYLNEKTNEIHLHLPTRYRIECFNLLCKN